MNAHDTSIYRKAAIVGVGQTELVRRSDELEWDLALRASLAAAQDAGIDPRDIDGVVRFGYDRVTEGMMVRGLGIRRLSFYGEIGFGSLAQCAVIAHAAMAIATGQASAVLVYRSLNQDTGIRYGRAERHLEEISGVWSAPGDKAPGGQFCAPYGYLAPGQGYALAARRYQFENSLSDEQLSAVLGKIAIDHRVHACGNPAAMMHGKPLTMADYLASRVISSPLRLYDYCLESAGAGAVILVSADRARALRKDPVFVLAASQMMIADSDPTPTYMSDLTSLAAPEVAQGLYEAARIRREDLVGAMLYDAFTPLVLFQLEAYGLATRGEGWRYVLDQGLGLQSALPVNTHGGMLSEGYLHGFNHITEAVRQLRGVAANQIGRDGPILVGGHMMSSLILGR